MRVLDKEMSDLLTVVVATQCLFFLNYSFFSFFHFFASLSVLLCHDRGVSMS